MSTTNGRSGSAPGPAVWYRRLGRVGWSVTGAAAGAAALVVVAAVLLPLILPLLVMIVVAVTIQPAVDRLQAHRVPRGAAALAGAIIVPAVLIAVGVLLAYVLVTQASGWRPAAEAAGTYLRETLGADPVRTILGSGQWRTALLGLGSALTNGAVIVGQIAVGLLAGSYLLFYALRDGPRLMALIESRLPLPAGSARALLRGAAVQFRRYVLGTTAVAALDALVITAGAAVLRVPFLLVIAAVTFVAAYVPYLGAWVSAGFAVMVAIGAGGLATGLWMLGIVLVTQNILEGVLRPIVFGRALRLHPVVVLVATVVGAAIGGLAGVFLAPPVAAIVMSWWSTIREHRS
ncbi:AI-2E family transporter [Dactylosporangium roseum]|uniref:AI-2E family transporter n=1 Tax=Dactylosporangium roseum TaxID=47989 RepID=A0ABY5ZAJ1_9ACTN|nr:AI-2E family transporter [Dactylosporangium roseum]UWZ38882.1 AI-2E family transporter [Dactylosporangium roseum]